MVLMDKSINPQTRAYDSSFVYSLQNAVYLRLTTPLGRYWADATFGSLLHTIAREKDLSRVGRLAQQYAEEALAPIIDDGRAQSIVVTHEQPHNARLLLLITVIDNSAKKHTFNHEIKVI